MSKVINIGGRLHSTEQGNVLTGANEILDDTKGKKQNVINSETDAELLRLEQSKQDNLTFDNVPTENSNNPVKSGGVYAADKALSDAIEAILLLIPSAASVLNKLADIAFVNSSVSTATATFRGTYNVVTDLELAYDATHEQIAAKLGQIIATADNNDYSFVQIPVSATSTNIRRTERYKYNGTAWAFEYDLNTSGFTAAQWEAINSGITALLVAKLSDLPTATTLAIMFAAKQNTLTFDSEPTALSTNPVTSGGIYTAVQTVATALTNYENSINALIPSEATDLNQLADKAYVLAKILDATPAFKGQFVTLAELQAVASPNAGDLGIVRTKDNDGLDIFTFYQYLNNTWNVFYTLQHHPQDKPATTGTTGDYPYNGMGRVELAMNMVNTAGEGEPEVLVNTLTQDMFYKGEVGSRVPNTNTIFVIQYDYELAEDITIPDNCVLEFTGGSLSGVHTLTLNDCQIIGTNSCFSQNISFSGKTSSPAQVDWFKGTDAEKIEKAIDVFSVVNLSARDYMIDRQITINHSFSLKGSSIPDFFGSDYGEGSTYDYSQTKLIGTFVKTDDASGSILAINGGIVSSFMSFTISDVSFTCSTLYGVNGINIHTPGGPSRPMHINNCNFKGLNYGIYVYGSNSSNSTNADIINATSCNMTYNNWAFYSTGSNGVMNAKFDSCNMEANILGGFYADSCNTILFLNCLLEGQDKAINATVEGTITIDSCYFERSGSDISQVNISNVLSRTSVRIRSITTSTQGVLEFNLSGCRIIEFDGNIISQCRLNLISCIVEDVNKYTLNVDSCQNSFFKPMNNMIYDAPELVFDLAPTRILKGKLFYDGPTTEPLYSHTIPAKEYRFVGYAYIEGNAVIGFVKVGEDPLFYIAPIVTLNGIYMYVNDYTLEEQISGINTSRLAIYQRTGKIICSGMALYDKSQLNKKIPNYNPNDGITTCIHSSIVNPSYGDTVFDTALNKALWYNGSAWVDATGTPV